MNNDQTGQRSMQQKIMLLRSRYKSTKDLWLYMTERLGYLMPSLKQTRLSHLQAILAGRKKALKQSEVPARTVPHWPQLAVKHHYDVAVKLPHVADYLPDPTGEELRLPERDFFWKVVYTLHPEKVDELVQYAAQQRQQKTENLQEQQWAMGVNQEWIDQLLLHDFTSTKRGRGLSSLLIQRIGREARGTKRRKLDGGDVEEDKRPEHAEDAMIDDLVEESSQQAPEKILLPGSSGKVIGTRANKKRQFDRFRKDQAAAASEHASQASRDFRTPQTTRNSAQKKDMSGILEEDEGDF